MVFWQERRNRVIPSAYRKLAFDASNSQTYKLSVHEYANLFANKGTPRREPSDLAKWRVAINPDEVINAIQPQMSGSLNPWFQHVSTKTLWCVYPGKSSYSQICQKEKISQAFLLDLKPWWDGAYLLIYWAQQSSLSRYAAPRPQLVYKRGSGVGSPGSVPEAVALQR